MNRKIITLIFCMVLLVGSLGFVSAGDYLFQNTSGTNLTKIYGPTGNMDVYGNVSASWFKGVFNWIVNSASSLYLSFNGTDLSFSQSALNTTIGTYNTSMLNYVNAMNISQNTSIGTWVNTNFAPVSEPLWTANLTDHNATWTTTLA